MQLAAKIKNKSVPWTTVLRPRVGTVVSDGTDYYYNLSGINAALSDTSNWFRITNYNSSSSARATVLADNIQVLNFTPSSFPGAANPFTVLFWIVMDDLPGYDETDKSTWTWKQLFSFDTRFTMNSDGSINTYTFDLGTLAKHCMYQVL